MTEDSAMIKEEYIAKYGEKDGLRRWKTNEYSKQYAQEHREEHLKYLKQYRQTHREELLEYQKQYYQDHRKEKLEYYKQWRQSHREEILKKAKQYHQEHREGRLKYMKQYSKCWSQTPYGRAQYLINTYRRNDRQHNRGDCTLTAKWVVDNIFNRSCLYCGEEDWKTLGCDRIDNSLPHTPQNVVCSCEKCNKKRHTKDFLEFVYSMGAKDSDGLIIK